MNILAIAGSGTLVAAMTHRLLRRPAFRASLFLAGWAAVVVPSILIAVALGLQPALAHTAEGTPLYFPFGLQVTLPALVLPHLILGVAEGFLVILGWQFFQAGSGPRTKGATDA